MQWTRTKQWAAVGLLVLAAVTTVVTAGTARARRWALAGRLSSELLDRRDLAGGDRGGAPELRAWDHRRAPPGGRVQPAQVNLNPVSACNG